MMNPFKFGSVVSDELWEFLKAFNKHHWKGENTKQSIIFLLALLACIFVSCTNEFTPKRQTMSLDGEWMIVKTEGEFPSSANTQWLVTLHERFKDMNWSVMRYCIGFPPERWYDICDSDGSNLTSQQRLEIYARRLVELTEYWRAHRRAAGVLHFCGLAYSRPLEPRGQTSDNALNLLIGTYTSGTSAGIYVYRFDEDTGEATYVSEAKTSNPSYLAVSDDRRFVYSVSESGRDAMASAFSFDNKAGMLSLLNSQPTNGAGPCYISIDPSGRFVVTANYSGGNISVFPIASDGTLQPVEKVFGFEGSGPDAKRQDMPHLHSVVFAPDGRHLFAADLGTDRLHKFTTSGITPFLATGNPEAYLLEPGSGPRHLTFHPNGKYAYLVNELSGKVTVFRYSEGQLEAIQYIPSDLSEGVGGKGSADIHVSPDGKFLYASNRANTDNIAIFSIEESDGRLTLVGHQPTGRHPRNFIITPNGKYLLAACQNSNLIQVFEIDKQTGLLNEVASKQITEVDRPVCLKFAGNP